MVFAPDIRTSGHVLSVINYKIINGVLYFLVHDSGGYSAVDGQLGHFKLVNAKYFENMWYQFQKDGKTQALHFPIGNYIT